MKRVRMFILLIVMLPLLTSCWGKIEIIDIALVTAIAIDKGEDDNYLLSLQIAVPKNLGSEGSTGGSSGESEPTIIVSEEGPNIMHLYRQIQMKLPREIFFAHTRVLIISEELAAEGISPVLDFLSRYRQPKLGSMILVTKGMANDVLSLTPQLETMLAQEMREQEERGAGIEVKLRDFVGRMLADGVEPIAAQVSSQPLDQANDASELIPSLDGAAVFQGDQLVGWMDAKEARGILWVRNEFEFGVVTVEVPDDQGGGNIGAEIKKASTELKPDVTQDDVSIKVDARGEVEIFENSSTLDLEDPQVMQMVKKMFETEINERLELTINKAQKELKSDVFGFGQAVYRENPRLWREHYNPRWSDVFPEIETEVATEIKIRGTGFSTRSTTLKNGN